MPKSDWEKHENTNDMDTTQYKSKYQITLQAHPFGFISLIYTHNIICIYVGVHQHNTEWLIVCNKQDGPKVIFEIVLVAIQNLSLCLRNGRAFLF